MKYWLLVIVTILVVLVIAIANAPASLVPRGLAEIEARGLLQAGSPRLLLADTHGTIWQGQADQAALELNGTEVDLGAMTWRLDVWSLLRRAPVLEVLAQAPGQQVKATVTATERGLITVDNLEGRVPISILEPWIPLLVKGDMAFVLDHLVFDAQKLHAIDGVLNLEYVDWLGGDYAMPLGSYMAQISLRDNLVQVQLNDFSASLGLDGRLSVSPTGAYGFNARLQPRADLAPEVVESLRWLGKRQANGDVLINTRGQF